MAGKHDPEHYTFVPSPGGGYLKVRLVCEQCGVREDLNEVHHWPCTGDAGWVKASPISKEQAAALLEEGRRRHAR